MWSLSGAQRADTVQRVKWNIASVAFFRGVEIPEAEAEAMAAAAERKAYTVAQVESRTTTGHRPAVDSLKAYARKLSSLVVEAIQEYKPGQVTAAPSASAAIVGGESLDLTGSREFLTTETASEALAPLLAPGAKLSAIKFSTKSFGRDAAAVAVKGLANIAGTLRDADLSDVIAGRPEDEALDVLRTLSSALTAAKLRSLNLSDNALGEKGIRACAEALTSQSGIEALAFQNVGCSVKACAALDELTSHTSHLKQLHLYNNMSGCEGAASIASLVARCSGMRDFKMVSSRVGADGGIALAKAFSVGSSLTRLDLHDNPMTAEVAPALALALPRHTGLIALNLNDTSLGDEGVAAIAAALAQAAPQLQELELALNEITAEGAVALAQMLTGKKQLRVLNLAENELEDKGACMVLGAASGLPALETLDLTLNQVKRAGSIAAAKFATSAPALKLLALNENEIPEDAVDMLREAMEAAGKSHALGSLEDNCPDEDENEDGDDDGVEDDEGLSDALQKAL